MPNKFILLLLFLPIFGCSELETSAPTQPVQTQAQSQPASSQQRASAATSGGNVQILPATPTTGDDLRVVVSGVSGKLSYRWEINGQPVERPTGATLKHDFFAKSDRVTAVVTVGNESLQVDALIYNAPPRILSIYALPKVIHRGLDIIITPHGEDPDGDEITYAYTWLINDDKQLFENSATLPGNLFQRDDRIVLIVTPSDGEDVGQPFRTGELVVANAPPHFVSLPPTLEPESATYRYAVRAVDPDNDPLAYSLEIAPPGMTIGEKSGMLTWQMDSSLAGEHEVVILVTDPHGAQNVQTFNINLTYAE